MDVDEPNDGEQAGNEEEDEDEMMRAAGPVRTRITPKDKDTQWVESATLENMEQENLRCSICLYILDEPHITRCAHRFCKKCLQKHMQQEIPQFESHTCPDCRQPVSTFRSCVADTRTKALIKLLFPNR